MSLIESFFELSQLWQALIIGSVATLVALWKFQPTPWLPPGPRIVPLIGQVLDIDGDTIETFTEWANFFGSYMTVYFGRVPTIVLNTRKAVDEALVKQQTAFTGRPNTFSAGQIFCGKKGIVFSDYTPTLQQQRKIVHTALRSYSFLSGFRLETKINQSLMKVVELLKVEKMAVDPSPFMKLITFNVLCGICFDEIHDLDDEDFRSFMNHQDEFRSRTKRAFYWEDIIPPVRWLPTSRVKKVVRIITKMKQYIQKKLEEHKDTFDPENVRDVADAMLLSKLEDEEEEVELQQRLNDDHLTHALIDIFNGGNDTIHLTLTWTILHLAVHREIQEKVQQELDKVLEKRAVATLIDRPNMCYLQAVINESMRLSTVVPFGVPHTAVVNTNLESYDVPKGTNILVNHWFLNHDPKCWEEPDCFKPERFLTEEGKLTTKSDQFIPFSVGKRSCLGEYLAKPELHLVLAGLLKHFHISLPEDDEADFQPIFRSFLSFPKKFHVIFKSRS